MKKQGDESVASRIAGHWDKAMTDPRPSRTRWWQSLMIRRHINRLVAGREFDQPNEGLHFLLRRALESDGSVSRRGVSVGAGTGDKEMRLVMDGVVDRFDLYELSGERIRRGRQQAEQSGLGDRIEFHQEDAFSSVTADSADLVYWHMALHHMLDVDGAVRWSRRVLRQGGYFCMNDFVGPSRFQWSDESLALVNRIRQLLPRRYLKDPFRQDGYRPTCVQRPDPEALAKEDPSEAADSERILASVEEFFPKVTVIKTGGIIYHLALRNILCNFDEENHEDRSLLGTLLLVDEFSRNIDDIDNHYATALSRKI